MKRLFYEPTEHAQFRRRLDHGVSYQVRHPVDSRIAAPTDMATGNVIQADQATEEQSRPDSQPPIRRRCQVACWRCRKRKIRCSGDTGNGQACANCKNSGTNSCVFMRVNSSPVQPGTPWQYGILKSATSPPSEARRGNYEPQQYAGTSSIPLNSTSQLPSTSAPSPASQVDFDYGTTPPSSAFDRSSYGSASSLGYDDSPMAYTMQAPSYLLPSSDTSAVSGFCGIPSNLRGWPSSTQPFKPTNAQLYCDIDSQSPLAPSPNYSFSSHASSQGPALTESTSAFPVGATLPPGLTGAADRTLPDPAGGRNNSHMQHASGADNLANNNASSSLSDHCRKPHSLSADVFLPGNDRYVASNVITTSEAMKAAAASTPQDMGFGYIPISNSSPVPTVDVTNGFQSSHSEMERSKREDLLYPPNICSASAYVYSTGTKSGTPYDSEPTATLTSGHEYTQLIDPHSRPVVMGSTAEDLRPINTNGNPISSYGGRSGF